MQDKLNAYLQAKQAFDTADAALKQLRKQMQRAEGELIEAMLEGDLTSVKTKDTGLTIVAAKSFNVSVTLGNTEEWLQWIESRGGNRQDFLRETMVNARLREFAKPIIEAEGKLAFGDLPVDETPRLSVRGWKQFMAQQGVEVK